MNKTGSMNYLQVENLTKYYGELCLYENIGFTIAKGQKTGIIAKNGAGKTTLLNILTQKDSPENGKIDYHPDIKIGYLEQIPVLSENHTILEEIFNRSDDISNTIRDYESAIEQNQTEKLSQLMDKMDRLNLWDFESRIKQILTILKINRYSQKISTLSGGQKKRVALATFLISEPDFLIMDEPTNHLDLEMIEWLEDYLSRSSITLLMVTHDRYFLDRVCNEIVELENRQIFKYPGNYSYFVQKRDERLLLREIETDKAKSLYKKELEWMRRMPQARGTKAKYRIDKFYETEEKAKSSGSNSAVQFNVKTERLGKKILEIHEISKRYDDLLLIDKFSHTFNRFEKVGIIGKNGTGKSTFLNIITNNQQPDSGTIETGETIRFGYFKQDGLTLDESQKVIDVVREIAEVVTLGDGKQLSVSQFLNHFLFPPETHHLFVSKLSGGEKRRLYLATVLMQNPNFLILDEPTNDLDIQTLNLLEDYLSTFNGCVIVVSHDRFFMDKIVDHIFVFEGDGVITDFTGNYTQYRNKQEELSENKPKKVAVKETSQRQKNNELQKKLSFKEKKELEDLEKEISRLEAEKSQIESSLNSGHLNHEELLKNSERISIIIKTLDEKSERWFELKEKE